VEGSIAERKSVLDDEHAWMLAQAAALRARRLDAIDARRLAEFLDDMAKRDLREVNSRLVSLLAHLIKFEAQPERATRSWALTVVNRQAELSDLFESPSLRQHAEAEFPKAWARARRAAAAETGLDPAGFPGAERWTLDAALAWEPPRGARPRKAKGPA
jgi:hypothetical protein